MRRRLPSTRKSTQQRRIRLVYRQELLINPDGLLTAVSAKLFGNLWLLHTDSRLRV